MTHARTWLLLATIAAAFGAPARAQTPPQPPATEQLEQPKKGDVLERTPGVDEQLRDLRNAAARLPIAVGLLALRTLRAASVLRRACADADVVIANSLLTLPALALARSEPPVGG